ADVVRARVRAIPRSDAAVVHLRVQPILGVMAGVSRTHRFAGSVLAVLAHHRAELETHVRKLAFPIALDANPVLRAATRRLVGANRRDVVLGMARGHTRTTPVTTIQIDCHAPLTPHTSHKNPTTTHTTSHP